MQPIEPSELLGGRLARLGSAVRRALETALGGKPLDEEAAQALIDSAPEELPALLAVAGHVRNRHKGQRLTYSPKAFLPVTNLCRDYCSYCTFRADPGSPHAWTMMREEVQSICREARRRGCIEALMCLGDRPERVFPAYRETLKSLGHTSTIGYVEECCRIALDADLLPHTNAGVMTRDEMLRLRPYNPSMGLMLENVSSRLREHGQAHHNAPDKEPALRIEMTRVAGELRIPFTSGILIGIGENHAERIATLAVIRDLHARYGHIQEVIVQNFRAKPGTRMATRAEPEGHDLARTIAVTRLMMPDMNVQAPPNLSPYEHQLLLRAGINDWGGISPLTRDYVNPEAPWPHVRALAESCARDGFILEPRLPIYDEYTNRPEFLDSALRERVRAERARLACGDGEQK